MNLLLVATILFIAYFFGSALFLYAACAMSTQISCQEEQLH